jgi:hypothetical protein
MATLGTLSLSAHLRAAAAFQSTSWSAAALHALHTHAQRDSVLTPTNGNTWPVSTPPGICSLFSAMGE